MSLRLVLCLAVVFVALSARHLAAQVPTMESLRTGTASISGQVVDARSGEPLANVSVALTAPRIMGVLQAKTDEAGMYQFADLAEHDYNVRVLDPLYLQSCFGATDVMQLACSAITLQRNQRRTGIDLRLTLTAILRGRVLDDAGRPVAGANVAVQPAPSATPAGGLGLGGSQTKADGSFELSLAGGDWVLTLDMPVPADKPRPPAVFYPGVIGIQEAEVIRVSPGLVTSGLTFRYPKIADRSLTARVSAPPGATAKAYVYRVEPRMRREIGLDAEGVGSVRGLLDGRYYVLAVAHHDGSVLVTSEIANVYDTVELTLLPTEAGRISGKVVGERGGLPPLDDVRVSANWFDEDGEEIDPVAFNESTLGAGGSFFLDGLFGLRRIQLAGLPPEWRVLSIREGRNDIATTGITVASGATVAVVITIGLR